MTGGNYHNGLIVMDIAAQGSSSLPQALPGEIPGGRQWKVARQRVARYLEFLGINGSEAENLCDLALRMTAWKAPRISAADIPGAAIHTLQNLLAKRAEHKSDDWALAVWACCNQGRSIDQASAAYRAAPAIHRRHMHPEHSMPVQPMNPPVKMASRLKRLFTRGVCD